jgi:Asp-tRNA(Asn)/Glu-tRNA(Gln) amidotransferase A subunit family amidase
MDIAATLDQERRQGKVRSNLHGIPYLVKDNIASKDKMETTAGSWSLQGSIVPRDAHVVKRLRKAGAVLLGKATLSEWADMRSNNYSEGYSGRGGQARSSYNFTGKTPDTGYSQYLSKAGALKGMKFGIPYASLWSLADQEQLDVLNDMVKMIEDAGAIVVNGTELPHAKEIVSPDGWNW